MMMFALVFIKLLSAVVGICEFPHHIVMQLLIVCCPYGNTNAEVPGRHLKMKKS
jgi:hypothetical protein